MPRLRPAPLLAALTLALASGCAAPQATTTPVPTTTQPSVQASATATRDASATPASTVTPQPTANASAPPAAPGTPSAPGTPPRSVTVVLGGDMLWHLSLLDSVHADAVATGSKATYDFGPLFAGVKPLITRADLAVCNQEIPILAPGEEPTGYPVFGAPAAVAKATADLGFDACTTASNHSYDKGEAGLKSTLTALKSVGIATCGTAATQADGERPCLVTTKSGVTIGLVTGAWGLNGGTALPEWQYNTFKPDAMIARAKAARAAGAQIVLGSIHAGDEYVTKPNADQTYVAGLLARSGQFDLIYSHHSHVVQPWTTINGTPVIYGLGNFVGQMSMNTPTADEGILAELRFDTDAAGRFHLAKTGYAPLFVTHASDAEGARVLHLTDPAAARHADPARLALARSRIHDAVASMGATGIGED